MPRLFFSILSFSLFLAPIYLVRFSIGEISISALDVLLLLTIFAGTSEVIQKFQNQKSEFLNKSEAEKLKRSENFEFRISNFFKNLDFGFKNSLGADGSGLMAIGFILIGLLTSFALHPSTRGLGIIVSWFLLPITAAVLAKILLDEKQKEKLLFVYIASASALSFISLGFYITGNTTYDGRLAGIYSSPNMLAMYIAPAIVLAWFLRFSQQRTVNSQHQTKLMRWFLLFAVCCLFFVLLLTQSLGGILSVVSAIVAGEILLLCHSDRSQDRDSGRRRSGGICMAVSQFFGRKFLPYQSGFDASQRMLSSADPSASDAFARDDTNKGFSFLISFFILLIFATFSFFAYQKFAAMDFERSSLASRMMIWRAAWDMGKDHPLFGIGPGNFQEQYLNYQQFYPPYLEWSAPHPHNIFLAFWLGSGIIGLAGFVMLISSFSRDAINRVSTGDSQQKIAIMMTIFAILLHGLIDTTIWRNDLGLVFWLLMMI